MKPRFTLLSLLSMLASLVAGGCSDYRTLDMTIEFQFPGDAPNNQPITVDVVAADLRAERYLTEAKEEITNAAWFGEHGIRDDRSKDGCVSADTPENPGWRRWSRETSKPATFKIDADTWNCWKEKVKATHVLVFTYMNKDDKRAGETSWIIPLHKDELDDDVVTVIATPKETRVIAEWVNSPK